MNQASNQSAYIHHNYKSHDEYAFSKLSIMKIYNISDWDPLFNSNSSKTNGDENSWDWDL